MFIDPQLKIIKSGAVTRTVEKADFLGRMVCQHWRMTAGLVCLAVSITAIFLSIAWNTSGLGIFFGIGGLCSVYTIYLGYQFHNLQSLEKSVGTLSDEVDRLKEIEKSNKASVEHLEGEIEKLAQVKDELIEEHAAQLKEYINQLNTLKGALTKLEEAATGNHKDFGTNLDAFKNCLTELASTKGEFTDALSKTGRTLENTLEEVKKWMDEEHQSRQIEQQQRQQELINANAATLREIESERAATEIEKKLIEEQVTDLREELAELKKVKKELSDATRVLLGHLDQFKDENEALSTVRDDLQKITNAFSKIED